MTPFRAAPEPPRSECNGASVAPSPSGELKVPVAGVDDPQRRQRLQRMIERDYRLIWRLLRRLGLPTNDADDSAQQVFLIAAERLDDIQLRSERAFVFGTALRVAQSFRRRARRETISDDGDSNLSRQLDPEQLTEQRRALRTLNQLLEVMPFDLRSVFILFELEALTSPEIASLLGLPLGTVASRLRRAREQFRSLVAQSSTTNPHAQHAPARAGREP
jgi:RNA polymerase sigma-70 factor, ECF subfamily